MFFVSGACASSTVHPPVESEPIPRAVPSTDASVTTLGALVSGSAASASELETEVAVAPNGKDAFAIWRITTLGNRYDVGYSVSHDGGATWGPALRVPARPDVSVNPAVTVDGAGVFHVVWLENPPRERRRVMFATYLAETDVFTVPLELSDASQPSAVDKPWIASLPDGALFVAYGSDSGSSLFVARRTDGVTWQKSTLAPNGTLRNVVFPCFEGATLHLAYLVPSGVEVMTSRDSGKTFDAPVRVDAPKEDVAFEPPSCVVSGGALFVAYGVGGGVGSIDRMALLDGVMVARSSDGGRTFSDHVLAVSPPRARHAMLPRLARTDTGLALGAYVERGDAAHGWFQVAFSPDGAAWSEPVVVASPVGIETARGSFDALGDYVGMSGVGQRGGVLVSFADNGATLPAAVSHVRIAQVPAP